MTAEKPIPTPHPMLLDASAGSTPSPSEAPGAKFLVLGLCLHSNDRRTKWVSVAQGSRSTQGQPGWAGADARRAGAAPTLLHGLVDEPGGGRRQVCLDHLVHVPSTQHQQAWVSAAGVGGVQEPWGLAAHTPQGWTKTPRGARNVGWYARGRGQAVSSLTTQATAIKSSMASFLQRRWVWSWPKRPARLFASSAVPTKSPAHDILIFRKTYTPCRHSPRLSMTNTSRSSSAAVRAACAFGFAPAPAGPLAPAPPPGTHALPSSSLLLSMNWQKGNAQRHDTKL